MTYLKWRRKKTVNREFWVGHNYPSQTKEKGKHSQINASWGSLLLIDLPCVKCWRVAFRPTAGVLCLLFGVGQGTCILNITYGFFNRKQKNKPKNKQNCITRYIFLSSRLIKTEKKKKVLSSARQSSWWLCQLVQPLWKTVRHYPVKAKTCRHVKLYRPLVGKLLSLQQKTYVRLFTLAVCSG